MIWLASGATCCKRFHINKVKLIFFTFSVNILGDKLLILWAYSMFVCHRDHGEIDRERKLCLSVFVVTKYHYWWSKKLLMYRSDSPVHFETLLEYHLLKLQQDSGHLCHGFRTITPQLMNNLCNLKFLLLLYDVFFSSRSLCLSTYVAFLVLFFYSSPLFLFVLLSFCLLSN